MTIKLEHEIPGGVTSAVSITGAWLIGWSGVLLILAFL
jgi:hypothetical protein